MCELGFGHFCECVFCVFLIVCLFLLSHSEAGFKSWSSTEVTLIKLLTVLYDFTFEWDLWAHLVWLLLQGLGQWNMQKAENSGKGFLNVRCCVCEVSFVCLFSSVHWFPLLIYYWEKYGLYLLGFSSAIWKLTKIVCSFL